MTQQLEASIPPTLFPSNVERFCSTQCKFSKFIYNWTIDGFRSKITIPDCLLQSMVFTENFPRMEWQLLIDLDTNPFGDRRMVFTIDLLSTDANISAHLELCILDPNGTEIGRKTGTHAFHMNNTKMKFYYLLAEVLSNAKPMIFDDRFMVRLELKVPIGDTSSEQFRNKVHELKLFENYGRLLESESLSDVTLAVGAESFRAHRTILAAQSPVFEAMFQHDMLENAEKTVTITDIRPDVFREALRFIYTGKVSDGSIFETMALDLLAVADKYQIEQLMKQSLDSLKGTISTETAVELLITAELHNATDLKARAVEFIRCHAAEVMLTEGWFKIVAYPQLLEKFSTKLKI